MVQHKVINGTCQLYKTVYVGVCKDPTHQHSIKENKPKEDKNK